MLKFKQIDEISKQLRDKYVERAVTAHGGYNMARRNTTGADQEYFARKEKNTQKGISRALDDKRLNKESMDIEEAKATMCGRCGTKHVHPSKGGKCPALAEASLPKGSMVPGIPSKRDTAVKRAARRAAVVPVEKAKATYGVGYRQESVVNEAKEKTEYDYEGDMARGQLQSIINNAQRVHDMLKDNDNLPEWVQSKITLAEDYISTVSNYMQSEIDEATVSDKIDKVASIYNQHRALADKARRTYPRDTEGEAKHMKGSSKAFALMQKMREKKSDADKAGQKPKPVQGHTDYSAAIAKDYKDQEARRGIGHVRDHVEHDHSNPYLGEGLVDEAREASYDGEYQSAVLRFREKAKKQEQERGPVDIQKLAARLKAVKLKPEGTKK